MPFIYGVATDRGTRKKINQDAVILIEAECGGEEILFAAVSDGMGGLASGEKASMEMVHSLERWFEEELPDALAARDARTSLVKAVEEADERVAGIGESIGAECGTTVTAVLAVGGSWFAVNVGDSRAYLHRGGTLAQVTKDHSYVQREIDEGRMTEAEAEKSDMRSVLLRCIGAGGAPDPDCFSGEWGDGDAFLLCSDGFRHKLSRAELERRLRPDSFRDSAEVREAVEECIEFVKEAGERDNITAVYVVRKGETCWKSDR